MMNTIKRRSNSHSTLTAGLLTVLFLILLGGVERAQAQWSSSGGNTTTTDNVGIGDTSPNGKLTVVGNILSEASAAHNSGVGILGKDASNAYLQLYNSSRSMTTYFSAKA